MKRIALLSLLAAAALLSACSSSDPLSTASETAASGGTDGSVVVGSANFPENELLADIYAGALKGAGVDVSSKLNIGSREAYIAGLKDGSIDLIPEYTGGLLQYFSEGSTAKAPDQVYDAAKAALPAGLTLLDKAAAEDKDSLVVTKETADKYNLSKISDLSAVADKLVIGGPPEWRTRPDTGIPALKKTYGLTFQKFQPLDVAGPRSVQALKNGQVDVVNLFTTDPNIVANDFVVLEDDKNMFAAQNVVPLIRTDAAKGDVADTLNAVSAKLDTDTLAGLVKQVVADKKNAADVAQQWLSDNGLS